MKAKIKIEENYITFKDELITRIVIYLENEDGPQLAKYVQFNGKQPIELKELVPALALLIKELENFL